MGFLVKVTERRDFPTDQRQVTSVKPPPTGRGYRLLEPRFLRGVKLTA